VCSIYGTTRWLMMITRDDWPNLYLILGAPHDSVKRQLITNASIPLKLWWFSKTTNWTAFEGFPSSSRSHDPLIEMCVFRIGTWQSGKVVLAGCFLSYSMYHYQSTNKYFSIFAANSVWTWCPERDLWRWIHMALALSSSTMSTWAVLITPRPHRYE